MVQVQGCADVEATIHHNERLDVGSGRGDVAAESGKVKTTYYKGKGGTHDTY